MNRLPLGPAAVATVRKCGHVYVPYRVLRVPYPGFKADIFWGLVGNDIKVVFSIAEDIEGRSVVMEANGFSIHIAPIYSYVNWGRAMSSYKVPVNVLDDFSFEILLRKDLHHGA